MAFAKLHKKFTDISLVYFGSLAPQHIEEIELVANLRKIPRSKVVFLSNLTDQQVSLLYQRALISVVPSFSEGFSLPVVESLCHGTPVVASKISAHAELLDQDYLFDPSNPNALIKLLSCYLENLDELFSKQSRSISGRFTQSRIDENVRCFFERHMPKAEPIVAAEQSYAKNKETAGKNLRLAIATPWPPQATGVADYSKSTFSALSTYCDLTILTNSDTPVLADNLHIQEFNLDHLITGNFDAILYVIGNSHFHKPFIEIMRYINGPCLAHDVRMIEYYNYFYSLDYMQKIIPKLRDGHSIHKLLENLDEIGTTGFCEIVKMAEPILVHSARLKNSLELEFAFNAEQLPFVPYNLPDSNYRLNLQVILDIKKRLLLPIDSHQIVMFGMVDTRTKCVDFVVEAINWLWTWGYNVELSFVGSSDEKLEKQLLKMVKAKHLDKIRFVGNVKPEVYSDWLLAADATVQIRSAKILSLSGALLDCLAYGLPTVCNQSMEVGCSPSFFRVVPDIFSPVAIANALCDVLSLKSSEANIEKIESERISILAELNVDRYAKQLLSCIDHRTGGSH
jgi:glycosyltransferase involved in cell wall biosynthesis